MLPEAPGNTKTAGTGRRPRVSRGSGRAAGAYLAAGGGATQRLSESRRALYSVNFFW